MAGGLPSRMCSASTYLGLPAWLVWAFIHLMYIVQFESRIVVFIHWAIQDLTFSRGARLITGAAASEFNFDNELASLVKKPADIDKVVARR